MRKYYATSVVVCSVSLTSCQTVKTSVDAAGNVLSVAAVSAVNSVNKLTARPGEAVVTQPMPKRKRVTYADLRHAVTSDYQSAQKAFNELVSLLQKQVQSTWGRKEVKTATPKQYVKYSQKYLSRAVVDFDRGRVTVETLDTADPITSLRKAIVTTLLTPDDPRAVDLFTDRAIETSPGAPPYLSGLIRDQNDSPIDTPAKAEAYANYLVETKLKMRNIEAPATNHKRAAYVEFAMIRNFSDAQAKKYSAIVHAYAAQHRVSPSLVFAVIRTESNFNPYAVSSAPAYGLMQLVPSSGGRDAYRKVKGTDAVPSPDYLFDVENNIELGTAYLAVLTYNHLEVVQNETSREYCVISAYNTGAGNVFKAFAPSRKDAIASINATAPPLVYEKLRADLPYAETRAYLQSVIAHRKQFVSLTNEHTAGLTGTPSPP